MKTKHANKIGLYVNDELFQKIKQEAEKEGISRNYYLNRELKKLLNVVSNNDISGRQR